MAAILVDAVNDPVSQTDSIVAGTCLGDDAFVAIGVFTPFLTFASRMKDHLKKEKHEQIRSR